MNQLLSRTIKKFMIYAGIVLACSIPAYYVIISMLYEYEMNEHNIVLTKEAASHDRYLIIVSVTLLTSLFFIVLLGGFVLLTRAISKKIWQPFYESLGSIKNFNLTEQREIVFKETDIAEFKELNTTLHKLISGNIAVYNQQKEFADNASHELQTPLAVVQSKLELLLQSKALTNDQYVIIEEALKALARVGRINNNLLLLTKIENSQFMDKEMINLSDLVIKSVAVFEHFLESKLLKLQLNIHPEVHMEGNKILVEILLNNLLTNAIRHSPDHGDISINLSTYSLLISNSGSDALQLRQLFKRFATASSENPGTGLGLALAKQICNRYNWKIEYAFNDNSHVFSIHF